MRKLLFTVHLYVALAVSVFVLVLSLTGAIMAFEPEIDRLTHPKLFYITPGATALSLADVGAAVARAFPGKSIIGYTLASRSDLSYVVSLTRGQVFVNQYTGEILGVRTPQPGFLARVHQLHLRLLISPSARHGDPGRSIMSWVGVAILFLLLSGVYLWWPQMRLGIKRGATGRPFWFDLHNTAGMVSLVFLLLIAVTGIVIGFDHTTVPLLYKMTGSKPSTPPKFSSARMASAPISPDRALSIARGALPDAVPFSINVPAPSASYLIGARYSEDLTPGGRSLVIIDQYSGEVIYAHGSRTAPAGTRLVNLNRAIHTGDIFGIASRALMSLASLVLALQSLTGVMMWVKRGPLRQMATSAIKRSSAGG